METRQIIGTANFRCVAAVELYMKFHRAGIVRVWSTINGCGFTYVCVWEWEREATVIMTLYSNRSCVSWLNISFCLPQSGSTLQPPARLCTGLPFRQLLHYAHWNHLWNTEAGWMRFKMFLSCEQDRWCKNSLENLFSADNLSVLCSNMWHFHFSLCVFEGIFTQDTN